MLALITIFLATFLIAVTVIWLYRSIAGWQGFSDGVGSRKQQTKNMRPNMKLSAQQGFISMFSSSREVARAKKLRSPKDGIKAPWGW
mgnify:CR=1 FL=1